MTTFIRAVANRRHAPVEPAETLVPYTPEWVAKCYQTKPDQPCPEVSIVFPEWAIRKCCDCCVAAAERGELDHEVGDHCLYAPCNYHNPYPVVAP